MIFSSGNGARAGFGKGSGPKGIGPSRVRIPRVVDGFLFFFLVSFLTIIYSPVALAPPYQPQAGEVASRDIKADREILVEDEESTLERRKQAAREAPLIFDRQSGMLAGVADRIREQLLWLDKARQDPKESSRDALLGRFSERLGVRVAPGAFDMILAASGYEELINASARWLSNLSRFAVVSGPEVLKDMEKGPYVVRSLLDKTEKAGVGRSGVTDLEEMRRKLKESAPRMLSETPKTVREGFLLRTAHAHLRPDLVLNLSETETRRTKAFEQVDPVFFRARKGEMVVREGEVVSPAAVLKISALHEESWTLTAVIRLIGLGATLALFLWLGRRFLIKTSSSFPRDRQTTYLMGAVLVVVALFSTITFSVGQGLAEFLNWDPGMVAYLAPVALGPALISLIVGSRFALPGGSMIIGIVLSFLASLAANGGLPLFIFYIIGSLVGGFSLRSCRQRFDVVWAGFWIALFQMVMVPVVESLQGHAPSWEWFLGMGLAMAGGLLVGVMAMALIPLLESFFNVTTDSRLLELASGDHPVLKELSLRAPGTYHHSIMMGNLAEAGAESINANPLLARVMALYHDIGKLNKPHYFVENQTGENRHDHLSPSMSVKIIQSHVKKGLEMARRHKLGGPIMEAISEHQGTTLMQFFFNKAFNDAARKGEAISEEDFRYPGPKPQSPESGILMMADSVEAAARTLKSPSSAQIRALVRRLVAAKIDDGQLDECRLTLKEVNCIEEAFTRVLTLGFYHSRIAYPDANKAVKKEKPKREQKMGSTATGETVQRSGNGAGRGVGASHRYH